MATKEEVVDVLDRALELMNDKGAHWAQGTYERAMPNGMTYCSVGAIGKAAENDAKRYASGGYGTYDGTYEGEAGAEALYALAAAYGSDYDGLFDVVAKVTGWNDRQDTTWEKVVLRFRRAKSLIEKRGLRKERLYG